MKTLFYPRLAWDGIRKNRRMSVPYLLTCVCMVAMHYILGFLASPAALQLLPRGRSSVETILNLGKYVVLLFSLVFLFYTHSFLIRRRQREFGLYNVLGMGKRNLARILTWESLITFSLALAGGLLAGLALSKLAELGLVNLLGGGIDYRLRLDTGSLLRTLICYAAIFALIWLSAVIRTARSSAVSLMKAESMGEKPPKGNWVLALAGVGLLAAAYWLAVSVNNPLDALLWFFAAVLMVIVATYLVMIAGSVRLCQTLQRSKGYYYRPKHFVSVSSMAFRMKRNGAGLASICIIATMVLVMLSSTTCLWFGAEDATLSRYPREINLTVRMNEPAQLNDANLDRFCGAIADFAPTQGAAIRNTRNFRYVNLNGVMADGVVQCDYETANDHVNYGKLLDVYLVLDEDYATMTGEPRALAEGEAALLVDGLEYSKDEITLAMGEAAHSWHVASVEEGTAIDVYDGMMLPRLTLIVSDLAAAEDLVEPGETGIAKLQIRWLYGFDTGLSDEANSRFAYELEQTLARLSYVDSGEMGYNSFMLEARADGAADYFGSYGALFFIGILLSAVFLVAAVLIVYYKQISEGYEDAGRFDLMRKVGMTRKEIRASISSQLRTVFALPLAFAGLHLAFAFPMIRRLLTLFSLYNVGLFARTTLISFAVFAGFYWIVYRLTSGAYYRIVSGN